MFLLLLTVNKRAYLTAKRGKVVEMENMTVTTEFKRATTAQTFAGMRKEIENYSRSNSMGKSKSRLCVEYSHCLEVLRTLSKRDLLMIWYLRNSSAGMSFNFARAAEKQFQAQKALKSLE